MSKDYYKILGVQKNASQDEIKRAFRRLAHEHHPDKKGGDDAKFKEANEAYSVLGDEKKRAQYDQFGSAGPGGAGFGGAGADERAVHACIPPIILLAAGLARAPARTSGGRYNSVRTCHNSGNSSTSSIRRRYATPTVPPVPRFSPMTRSTVVTWLNRQRRK